MQNPVFSKLRLFQAVLAVLLTLTVVMPVFGQVSAKNPPIGSAVPNEIVVAFPVTVSREEVDKAAESVGCVVRLALPLSPNHYIFTTKTRVAKTRSEGPSYIPPTEAVKEAVTKLRAMPGVMADPNYLFQKWGITGKAGKPVAQQRFTPNDPRFGGQAWHMNMIRAPEAWSIQLQSINVNRPVIVAVSDTGLDVDHRDFQPVPGGQPRVFRPVNTTTNPISTNVTDTDSHGTHVAGTVGATTDNGIGVTGVAGYNGGGVDVRIMPIKIFADIDQVDAVNGLAAVISCMDYAIQNGADVQNMSWGGYGSVPLLEQAVARCIAAGMVMVGAAGNDASTRADIFPSSYPGVIRVSAVGPDRRLTVYSNSGPRVAIAAPGGALRGIPADDVLSTIPGNDYAAFAGTSMASPHVAGVCALLIAAGCPKNEVRRAIQTTAQRLDEEPVLDPNGSSKYGAGLIDAYAALLPFSDPPFSVRLAGTVTGSPTTFRDRGQTFVSTIAPIELIASGLDRLPSQDAVTVEVQAATTPTSVLRTLVGGRDFTIPTRPVDQPKGVSVTFDTGNTLVLSPGRYRLVVKYQGDVVGTEFVEVVAHTQPAGRSMFATPFQARKVSTTNPEQVALGTASQFTLFRYNTQRLSTSSDYARFDSASGGRQELAASFSALAIDSTPLVYEIANPGVSIAPVGLGYWLNLDRPTIINSAGPEVTNPVVIRLFAANGGWNMVGAPFTAASAWGSVTIRADGQLYTLEEAINRNIITGALIGYNNGDYVYQIYPAGSMEPFNGYWVRVLQDCEMILSPISSTRSRAAAIPTRSVATPDSTKGWRVRIGASASGDRDGQNYFGQMQGASDGVDRYDIPKPPSGAGHVYVRFISESKGGRSVSHAFDMRDLKSAGNAEWTMAVSTDRTNADVTVSWDGISAVPGRNDVFLVDPVTGQTIDMRGRSSYTFRSGEAGSTRKLTIAVKPRLSSGPLAIRNVTVVPAGRSTGQTGFAVQFNVSREAEIKGVVKSLNGTVVGDLTGPTRAVATGQTTLRWNGRSRSGSMVPPGAYLVEITATGMDGSKASFSQPVVNNQ